MVIRISVAAALNHREQDLITQEVRVSAPLLLPLDAAHGFETSLYQGFCQPTRFF
jgi:hypothetical protein